MPMQTGDTVGMLITRVEGYACWGTFEGLTGYMHCAEWSRTKPVPDDCIPKVGETLCVQVFRMVTEPQARLPLDVTFGGEMHVDFAASRALLQSAT
jgi:hypothetical protein